MKVEQFKHKNQFLLEDEKTLIFQSYKSTIAKVDKVKHTLTLGIDWDYSKTTTTHLYQFINEEARYYLPFETIQKINQLNEKANKRNYIEKLIKDGFILYDNNLV